MDAQHARHQFALMPHDLQVLAIRRLAAAGHGDHVLAAMTGLAVEQIRRVLAERIVHARETE